MEVINTNLAKGQSVVLACSALKQAYRDKMSVDPARVHFIYLKGSYELICEHMSIRAGHYMKPNMLRSQFDTLEESANAFTVNISMPP